MHDAEPEERPLTSVTYPPAPEGGSSGISPVTNATNEPQTLLVVLLDIEIERAPKVRQVGDTAPPRPSEIEETIAQTISLRS